MAQVKNQGTLKTPPIFERTFQALVSHGTLSKQTPANVMKLSNHYVAKPDAKSPWTEPEAREALLLYFHPLNQSRVYGVSQRAAQLGFFTGLTKLTEIGAGSGAATIGLLAAHSGFEAIELTDISKEILDLARDIVKHSISEKQTVAVRQSELQSLKLSSSDSPKTLAVFSYVLTEGRAIEKLGHFLKSNPDLEALAIFEPATQEDGRRLQSLRSVLQDHGYSIWAPCPHAEACPLLAESDRDWCHDRTPHFKPDWWDKLESELPIKNASLTVSYLFARKLKPLREPSVRVIGDPLFEKTKVRQMICRGPHREFMSWFPSRLGIKPEDFDLARGDLFKSSLDIFKDPRGADRSREYRLDLPAIQEIQKTNLTNSD